jgi:hypothetical protein
MENLKLLSGIIESEPQSGEFNQSFNFFVLLINATEHIDCADGWTRGSLEFSFATAVAAFANQRNIETE